MSGSGAIVTETERSFQSHNMSFLLIHRVKFILGYFRDCISLPEQDLIDQNTMQPDVKDPSPSYFSFVKLCILARRMCTLQQINKILGLFYK